MKFRFPFQAVLKYRHGLEQRAQRQYYQAKAKVDEVMNQINEMYGLLDRTRREIQDLQRSERGPIPDIQLREEFIGGLLIKIENERRRARILMSEAEEKHHQLLEAVKEFKALEKLRLKRHQEFVRQQRKLEAKEIDELVTMRYKREPQG